MTLSTSGIKGARIGFIAGAIFCLIFGMVYEMFSHGVISFCMILAFLIPLGGWALTEIFNAVIKKSSNVPYNIRKSGVNNYWLQFLAGAVTWFTLGCIFRGVLVIYGTTNHLMIVFWVAGALLLAAAICFFAAELVKIKGERNVY